MSFDHEFILNTLQSLVRIDSRNPGLEAGAPGEMELARHVRSLLGSWGYQPEMHDLAGNRANVVVRRPGTGSGPSLMINVHMDTVGVAGMDDPFSGAFRDGRVYGRGSQDTKGGMAAVLALAHALSEGSEDLAGELVFAFVADEENDSIGTADLVERVRTDAAVVIEPSELDVVIGHRGFGIFRIQTRGKTAHGGRPDLGVDANMHMVLALAELEPLRTEWAQQWRHPHLGSPSLHVPVLSGGRHRFVYSDACQADVECRVVPGQTAEDTERAVRRAVERATAGRSDLDVRVEPEMWRSPYEIDPDRPIVRATLAAGTRVLGREPRTGWHGWWEDSGLIGDAGIDAVVLGPTGAGLHTETEWVDVESVVQLADILLQTVREYCGK
ncbi:MAG: M20/M25/M40 family metallo-hydrolase [Candidatus Latescibacterota bacterium]|jgi:acetylornithine deacetylase